MNKFIVLLIIVGSLSQLKAQKYFTREGKITFLSHAPMEEISAVNEKATSVIDIESGAVEWAVLISAFKFKKALMEEHFNENYMESTKFPKAVYKGKIENLKSVDFSKDGTYTVSTSGELEIRGIRKSINPEVTFVISNGQVTGSSEFKILVADFDITIPKVVRENIAKEVLVSIDASYQNLK